MTLNINGFDASHLVAGLKVGYETLVSEDSGRNAAGDTVLDIINRKIKLYVSFRPMFTDDMMSLLRAMEPYVINVTFLDPKSNVAKTIRVYHGTPEPEYYNANMGLYKAFNLNFIEL